MPEMKSTKKQQQESTSPVTVQKNRAQKAKPTQGGSVPAWILGTLSSFVEDENENEIMT